MTTVLRLCAFLMVCLLACRTSVAQTFVPKPGETVMQIAIENRGDVYVLLHVKEAPKTTAQIIRLVRQGFYNGLRFHRVERSPKPYLVQVGDPASRDNLDAGTIGQGGSGVKVPFEENDLQNVTGAVGLAHNLEDRGSGDSQFYMLLSPAKFLDGAYTVFGQVVSGLDVMQKIERGDRITAIKILGS